MMHKEALEELAKVLGKYNIDIWGCGCCGSPNIDINGESVNDSETINKDTIETLIKSLENKQ